MAEGIIIDGIYIEELQAQAIIYVQGVREQITLDQTDDKEAIEQ